MAKIFEPTRAALRTMLTSIRAAAAARRFAWRAPLVSRGAATAAPAPKAPLTSAPNLTLDDKTTAMLAKMAQVEECASPPPRRRATAPRSPR